MMPDYLNRQRLTQAEAVKLAESFGFRVWHDPAEDFIWYVADLVKDFRYLSLISYQGVFVEAHYQVFLTTRDTRVPKGRDSAKEGEQYSDFQKRGFRSVFAALPRTRDELTSVLDCPPQG